jgi:uncharacterized protein (TIGR02271 family)
MPSGADQDRPDEDKRETVVPLLAEEVEVAKRRVETGRVRVTTVTHEREHLVDELLATERVEIERISVDRQVETMPAVREEGDTIIVPIVEEVLVIERRLILKEEVRIRRVRSTERHQESVIIRHQEAVVTRLPVEAPADEANPTRGAKIEPMKKE